MFSGINFDEIFGGGFGLDLGGLGSRFGGGLFDGFFGSKRHREGQGVNIRVDIEVPLHTIFTGGDETVTLSHLRACPTCHGQGTAPGTTVRNCETCHGTGHLVNVRKEGNVNIQESRTCPTCWGKGKFIDTPCTECGGTGSVDDPETLTVKIPAGAEEGMLLRIPAHGQAGSNPNEKPGDLLIVVHAAYDPYFSRANADLWHTEVVSVYDAILGGDVKILTLEEPINLHLPAGTQHNSVLRVAGQGLPYFGNSNRGDLYVRIHVHLPEKINDEERSLFEKLRSLSKNHI